MKTTITQKACLVNSQRRYRLIRKLTAQLQCAGALLKQDPTQAAIICKILLPDHRIVSTTLSLAQTERKLVVIITGTDTDYIYLNLERQNSRSALKVLCSYISILFRH